MLSKNVKNSFAYILLIILLIITFKDNFRRQGRSELISPIPLTRADEIVIEDKPIKAEVSYYIAKFDGFNCDDENCITASGEKFDENAFTCACPPQYKLGTKFIVSYGAKSIIVKCNDRGAFWKPQYGSRMLDLSKGAFQALAPLWRGTIKANIEILK